MGTPVLLRDIGAVRIGPAQRRGLADLDGQGEVVGGVVVARSGTNALQVIDAVKARIREIQTTLPEGVQIVPTYDRSTLIRASIDTLKHTLIEELIVVTLVILLFLLHFRSTLVPALLLPIAVVVAFVPMKQMGLTANIMSLGGIAIAIGAMVDAAIIVVENVHKRLEAWEASGRREPRTEVVVSALTATSAMPRMASSTASMPRTPSRARPSARKRRKRRPNQPSSTMAGESTGG